jgi:hypothetical protein
MSPTKQSPALPGDRGGKLTQPDQSLRQARAHFKTFERARTRLLGVIQRGQNR